MQMPRTLCVLVLGHCFLPSATRQERQEEIGVSGRMLLHVGGQVLLCPDPGRINKSDPADPVSVQHISVPLYVVLPSGKVPHKVAQVHMPDLITEKELQVVQVTWFFRIAYGAELLVSLSVHGITAVHTGQQHLIASHHQLGLPVRYFIQVSADKI